uniref:Uncharacterized protein n=1 Tax=Comamonas testosteroni TaxID=285 RepID=D3VX18_COMTE|nr:unknown [Comamonas testosteroni]
MCFAPAISVRLNIRRTPQELLAQHAYAKDFQDHQPRTRIQAGDSARGVKTYHQDINGGAKAQGRANQAGAASPSLKTDHNAQVEQHQIDEHVWPVRATGQVQPAPASNKEHQTEGTHSRYRVGQKREHWPQGDEPAQMPRHSADPQSQ